MSRYMQRPENALKRANEFIAVGKPARALETLYDVFRNKKWVYTWSETLLEPIMFKYLDLCVELKKSLIAKEGLFQYRNMFQTLNVNSLENVIRGYLRMAEEKTEAAREQSQQAVIEIDDLDNLATPESILLSAVSGEDAQDRSDRTILTPWVKFLWESYCQCLELLRTNSHCETLYHDIARMAFNFCLKYNRKTEFRKLCDKLRKHLEDISKLPVQVANVSINKPETQQYNLETRLVQLDSAIQMELWQEAYKAIEDIHGLMNLSKKLPVPKTMANYYSKLAMVFWKAGYYLFHAAALFKLFTLSKEMKKNITADELQRMACRVLLATLCIPLPSAHPEFDRFVETDKSPLEKAQRLATLLTLQQPPTRVSLIKDLVRMNIVHLASPQLQELYQCMEVEFNPLTLCNRVKAVTSSIKEDEQYIPPLQDVTLVKLIRQVSQIYQTIKFERLYELAVFTTPFHLERLLVDSVRHNDMQIRIDHRTGCVHFGMDLSESPRESTQDGPILQSMPSDQLRMQLVNMANVLNCAVKIINPDVNKSERDMLRARLVKEYRVRMIEEHQRILERHKIIEDRKEYLERLNTAREEEEARRAEEAARLQAIAEQRRLDQEREERERRRQENEIQQIKDRHLREKMQQISQTAHGQKLLKKLDEMDIKKLDADQIAAKEAEELQRERKEMLQKLKSQEKKVDYFERAKRIEEIPLLQESIKQKLIEDKKLWEEMEAKRIEALTSDRQKAVETRKRLAVMVEDRNKFLAELKAKRHEAYLEKMKPFDAKLAEERKKRLALRKEERIRERKALWEKQQEEERLRLEEEEKEKQRAEEKKRLENLERQAEIQRKREEEVARRQEEKEKALQASWREKERESKEAVEKEKDDKSSWRKTGPADSDAPKPAVYRPQYLREREKERERERDKEPSRDMDAPSRRGGGMSDSSSWRRDDRDKDMDRGGGFGRRDMDRGMRKGDRDDDRDRGVPPRRDDWGDMRRGDDREEMRRRDDRDDMRRRDDRDEMRRRDDRDEMRRRDDRDDMRRRDDRDDMRRRDDRERDSGRSDFWRSGDRDRDRDMDRGGSSFRDRDRERDRDRDRMDRRPPTEPMSAGSWRRGRDAEPETRRPESFRKEPPPPTSRPVDKGDDSGDDEWQTVPNSKR